MVYKYEHIIQFYEIDGMRIVHHANYLRWFETTRMAWLTDLGFSYKRMEEEGVSVPVLSARSDYKKMLTFGDTAVIHMRIAELTPVRLNLEYEVYSKERDELTTLGRTEHCFLDSESLRPISLKRRKPELLGLFTEVRDGNY